MCIDKEIGGQIGFVTMLQLQLDFHCLQQPPRGGFRYFIRGY